jgi:splicing factor 3A subunit 3
MASSILEETRSCHEDVEFLQRAIVKALFLKAENPRNCVLSDVIIRESVKAIRLRCRRVLTLYDDEDGARELEIAAMAGEGDLA